MADPSVSISNPATKPLALRDKINNAKKRASKRTTRRINQNGVDPDSINPNTPIETIGGSG